VRTTPEVWIVTGRNSKLPPLLGAGISCCQRNELGGKGWVNGKG
jgi:hypothetical protein